LGLKSVSGACEAGQSGSVRHNNFDPLRVSGRKYSAFSEISFSFGRLAGQDMAGIGEIAFKLSRPGFSEALCRASVGLDFGHLHFLR